MEHPNFIDITDKKPEPLTRVAVTQLIFPKIPLQNILPDLFESHSKEVFFSIDRE